MLPPRRAVLSTADPVPDGSPAVVLLSGGLDSTTCLAIAQRAGFSPIALSFRYGQRHDLEVDAARRLAAQAGVEHIVCDIDLRTFGGSALTADIDVPKHDRVDPSSLPPSRPWRPWRPEAGVDDPTPYQS